MSARCPQCGTSIENDYGVISCPQCAAVLFIDMDGQVQLSPVAEVIEPLSATPPAEEDPSIYSAQPAPTPVFGEEAPKDLVSEIQEYAQQPSMDTALSYTVVIECIDHAELRDQVKDILSDPLFGWNVSEIMKQQKMGRIEIPKINAVKASIVVRRLKSLPLKISWRQYAYT